ncbi:MAG: hypothetical protein M1812_007699 [Candelaria pacifica]|nr:MAG: hypothetical protein M1812_007699 [Candelaria pacifica]
MNGDGHSFGEKTGSSGQAPIRDQGEWTTVTRGRSRSSTKSKEIEAHVDALKSIHSVRASIASFSSATPTPNGRLAPPESARDGTSVSPAISPHSELTAWLSGQQSKDYMQELQDEMVIERTGSRKNSTVGLEDNPYVETEQTRPDMPPLLPPIHTALERIAEEKEKEKEKRRISQMDSPAIPDPERDKVLKLSPIQIQELTSSAASLPVRPASPTVTLIPSSTDSLLLDGSWPMPPLKVNGNGAGGEKTQGRLRSGSAVVGPAFPKVAESRISPSLSLVTKPDSNLADHPRPMLSPRTVSTPPNLKSKRSNKAMSSAQDPPSQSKSGRVVPTPLKIDPEESLTPTGPGGLKPPRSPDPAPSPMPPSIPLPPLSLPTYLQLELSSDRPSPLYIHRSATSDFPYESSKVTFERLVNFLLLAPQLEQVLWFGTLACLDAWLYSFTILPLRFFKALGVLSRWWLKNLVKEVRDIGRFIWSGLGRMWRRHGRQVESSTSSSVPTPSEDVSRSRKGSLTGNKSQTSRITIAQGAENSNANNFPTDTDRRMPKSFGHRHHRRTKSMPSTLSPTHKADMLKGLVVLFSCLILMRFDASRMYHGIRGQAAIKLYVIYNVLEVCDRLFSALGQDVFECLFSKETLERNSDGRSKLIRPFWMFLLALVYNVVHATALFYQVITLNVAVNSYSNALLTLLMSNQFVEIKSTVFKKFEKENLFQLTCADVVERFQLWLMLMIIALRNIVEVGGLNIGGKNGMSSSSAGTGDNFMGTSPFRSASILPKSFTIFPKWTGQVMGPFLLVLGSEMLVDWLKHAYITKFNNTKPAIYGRFLDVLAKDYYSNAFADQNLTRRLGLPVLPLSCLFIRASVQTYHMFLATHMPIPLPSPSTSISLENNAPSSSPATTAALQHIDTIFRRALGRSTFGAGTANVGEAFGDSIWTWWNMDDLIAFGTMLLVFGVFFLVLLATKLVLGMFLLAFARSRYRGMKEREKSIVGTQGRRVGGWGVVEVDEDKRRWIYMDDAEGARTQRERERERGREGNRPGGGGKDGGGFGGVSRYTMVAKRIW